MTVIRRCHWPETAEERDTIVALHARCMPNDKCYPIESAQWWVGWHGDEPVAYAAARHYPNLHAVFFVECGVVPEFRGLGIQRQLIRARMTWARKLGAERCVTYTLLPNVRSANSLIRSGFRRSAAWDYAGGDVDYWERRL